MPVTRIEALLDSLASVKGWSNPDSVAYSLRNPLLVKNFSLPGKNTIDEEGHRVFTTALAGIRASLFDLEIKLKGESRSGVKKDDNLANLLSVYGVTELGGQQAVVKFLKRALKSDPEVSSISRTTPLAWFLVK